MYINHVFPGICGNVVGSNLTGDLIAGDSLAKCFELGLGGAATVVTVSSPARVLPDVILHSVLCSGAPVALELYPNVASLYDFLWGLGVC